MATPSPSSVSATATIGLTLAIWSRSILRISSGVEPDGSAPTSVMRLRTSGCLLAAAISCMQPRDHRRGRALGREEAVPALQLQVGKAELRARSARSACAADGVATAIALSWPVRTCSSELDSWSPPNWMRPDSISVTSGAAPRNGTCSILMPASRLSTSPIRFMMLPGPVEP